MVRITTVIKINQKSNDSSNTRNIGTCNCRNTEITLVVVSLRGRQSRMTRLHIKNYSSTLSPVSMLVWGGVQALFGFSRLGLRFNICAVPKDPRLQRLLGPSKGHAGVLFAEVAQ